MSDVPEGLYYTNDHEWMRVEGDTVTIGITDHAQDMLTDIVYIELPEEGDTVGDMGEFAVVESVKSASPIFAPLAGTIVAVNMDLDDAPELMNTSPYGEGWIVKMTLDNPGAVADLMDAAAYSRDWRVSPLDAPLGGPSMLMVLVWGIKTWTSTHPLLGEWWSSMVTLDSEKARANFTTKLLVWFKPTRMERSSLGQKSVQTTPLN